MRVTGLGVTTFVTLSFSVWKLLRPTVNTVEWQMFGVYHPQSNVVNGSCRSVEIHNLPILHSHQKEHQHFTLIHNQSKYQSDIRMSLLVSIIFTTALRLQRADIQY